MFGWHHQLNGHKFDQALGPLPFPSVLGREGAESIQQAFMKHMLQWSQEEHKVSTDG